MIDLFKGKKPITICYKGKGVSINQFYSQGHWTTRNNIKKEYKPIFEKMIEEKEVPKMNEFALLIRYNSRHDPDNVTGMEKIFVDSLKSMNVIEDDSKKFYKFYGVYPDLTLEPNTFIFNIFKIS